MTFELQSPQLRLKRLEAKVNAVLFRHPGLDREALRQVFLALPHNFGV